MLRNGNILWLEGSSYIVSFEKKKRHSFLRPKKMTQYIFF